MGTDASTKPNILLIVSDDHGYGDQSGLGSVDDVETPALDRIRALGATFTQAYAAAPICSPARVGILTGAHPQRWGGHWFQDTTYPSGHPTIADQLAAGGYRTAYFGKVHYGPGDEAGGECCPENHGFDEALYSLTSLHMGRMHYMKHTRAQQAEYGEAAANMGVSPFLSHAGEVESDQHSTYVFAQRAIDFIERDDERPYFCYVAFNAVHNFAWQLPEKVLAERGLTPHQDWDADVQDYDEWYDSAIYPSLGEQGRGFYRAQLELMDEQIGRLLDAADHNGGLENTIVVYVSDNGGGAENYSNNAPLAGHKYSLKEGGIRVPFLISWPGGGILHGAISRPASTMDILPTVLAAAGVDPASGAPLDGCNELPALRGDASGGHDELHFDNGFQFAVRRGAWKLHVIDRSHAIVERLERVQHVDLGGELALTNVEADPSEQTNLIDQHPDIARELISAHQEWRKALGLAVSEVADAALAALDR